MEPLHIIMAACAAILTIALVIGFFKGFRRVSWGGFVWLVCGVAFFVLAEKTSFGVGKKAFLLAAACIVAALVAHGVCSMLFRPKAKWVYKSGRKYERDSNGFEYDPKEFDYDDYEEEGLEEVLVTKGYGKPSIFGRLLGGLICAVNTAMILGTILCAFFFVVDCTALKGVALFAGMYKTTVFGKAVLPTALPYVYKYALDLALIGIIVGAAMKGAKQGFLETVRVLVVKIGGLVAGAVGFYLPFSGYANAETGNYFLAKIVTRCTAMLQSFGLKGLLLSLGGKLVSGVLLCAFIGLALLIANFVLKQFVTVIHNVGFLKTVDGAISGVAFIAVGAVICAGVWAVLFTFNHYGILNFAEVLSSDSARLSQGLYELCEKYVTKLLP